MTKKRIIILVSVIAAILVLPIAASCCAIFAAAKDDGEYEPSDFTAAWMSYIKDDAPLTEVVIPGSHDAGTRDISYYGKTQSLSVKDQLLCGARYFDLRVKNDGGELVIFHSILDGELFEPILDDIAEFIEKHSTETVILDFQHFKNSEDRVCALLRKKLGFRMLTCTDDKAAFVKSLTMGEARGRALVFWGSEDDNLNLEFLFLRDNDEGTREGATLHSYYDGKLNKKSSSAYIKNGLPLYIEKFKKEGDGFFVLQGQLTDGLFVFGPRFRESTHCDNMQAYVEGLSRSDDLSAINIIMRDFVNSDKSCMIIRLNEFKGLVKSELSSGFTDGLSRYIKTEEA